MIISHHLVSVVKGTQVGDGVELLIPPEVANLDCFARVVLMQQSVQEYHRLLEPVKNHVRMCNQHDAVFPQSNMQLAVGMAAFQGSSP